MCKTRTITVGASSGFSARYEGTLAADGTIRGTFAFRFAANGPTYRGTWTARLGRA